MTLIAIFILIAHSLIQEGAIQGKSGLHPFKATLFRLGTAVITVALVAPLFGTAPERPEVPRAAVHASPPFISMLRSWALSTLDLAIRIFFILMVVITLLELLKTLGWVDP